ncbi:MAG: hypothetical protein H0T92_15730 [Pyrinomonadaceae bacterium]|nr:hypothetical protein [Pyrinomonadaceae bacterium]
MRTIRKLALIALALALVAAVWLWWNRPQPVDMTAYVPADSLVYLEANSLPQVVDGMIATDAWKRLAPLAGTGSGFSNIRWVSRLIAWTGIGPAEAVVLARAQVAVTVLGFTAEEEAGDTLKIKPRAAIIVESHSGTRRLRIAVEKLVGDFARRAYLNPQVERREADDVLLVTWSAPSGKRRIVAAVFESVAVIGNDDAAVQACLATRRGERPSLVGNAQLEEMRSRVDSRDALAFGFVPPVGAAKLLEVAATAYAGQLSPNPRIQSAAAILLPQLANRILGGAAWSMRVMDQLVEDRYFIELDSDLAARLQTALTPVSDASLRASELLPAMTHQLTSYTYQEPEAAWRGLNAAISSQLDALSAPLVARFLEEALTPYGIESPREFLRASGPELATARLDDTGQSTVLIARVRNREALREQVRRRLGSVTRERIGNAEMMISSNTKRGAASFVGDHLIMGAADDVRRCLAAQTEARALAAIDAFKRATQSTAQAGSNAAPAGAVTYTDDRPGTRRFVDFVAAARRDRPADRAALERELLQIAYSRSETRLIESGFERRTYSSFGQLGAITGQFAPETVMDQERLRPKVGRAELGN